MTWRPLPAPGGGEDARPLTSSLDRVARALGAPRARPLAVVFTHWEEVVGPALAAHSRPVSLRRGTLVVAVDHPSWATEIRWLASQLLAKLGQAAGEEVATQVEVRVSRRDDTGLW